MLQEKINYGKKDFSKLLIRLLLNVISYRGSNELHNATYWIVGNFLLNSHKDFIFIIFLAGIMWITLCLFLCYHLYLIRLGLTTNEKFRKTDHINFYRKSYK